MNTSFAFLRKRPSKPRYALHFGPGRPTMISPPNALRILEMRLGINVGRSTFYRWVQTGMLFSVKLGGKVFIPLAEIDDVIRKVTHGERLS